MKKYFFQVYFFCIFNGINRREILIRSLFYIVILYIFSNLWQATGQLDASHQRMTIWYLSITELIVLSVPPIQIEIENDIRSGDIIYHLLRPMSYLWIKLAEAMGSFLFRFFTLLLLSLPYTYLLSGGLPPLDNLAASLFAALVAAMVFILFQTVIGLSAFVLQDATPIYWLWQRASFLFGGLLLPLDYYPPLLKKIAFALPFASLLYAPANLVSHYTPLALLSTLLVMGAWAGLALFLGLAVFERLVRSLKLNGG